MMGDLSAVSVADLHHAYGSRAEVLRGVDLVVPRGSILALLGLNGAGKTTLVRAVLGLVRPTSGEVHLLGQPLSRHPVPPSLLARVGYVPERPMLDERATAGSLLALVRGVHLRWDEKTVRRYLEIFHIPLERRCKDLSTGTKAQLALAMAMAGNPELLILDEPTLGLDPLHRHQYLQLLLEEATQRDLTIVLTSHDLYQIERMADCVAILQDGRIAAHAPLDELKLEVKRMRVGTACCGDDLLPRVEALPGVRRVKSDPAGLLVDSTNAAATLSAGLASLPGVTGLQVFDLSLEEIFLVYCEE
jgi:ABC-2 type transport system ATP-binding protein